MKKGISLIVLVITIIVIIILASSVIINLSSNNPMQQSNEAAFKANLDAYYSLLSMYTSSEYAKSLGVYDPTTLNAGTWDGVSSTTGTIKEFIPSITTADAKKFEIITGKLVYTGSVATEKTYVSSMGQPVGGVEATTIQTSNKTFSGGTNYLYNNPIIPAGFKAINTTDAKWNSLSTDWNKGLVIEDASGNQFVWVPVDGTNVPYAKWCTTGIAYNDASISDDSFPGGINEQTQISNYKGFYIARYESMFDYNGGSRRVASKVSANKTISDWSTARNATYNGYLWNYINYTDSKTYAENMDTAYAYDTTKVGTNLVTGAQWDTVMKWTSNNSGPSVTDSRAWGNYYDSIFPANVSGYRSLQISGYSNNWKVKNIYDLAGNTWEWTNETYNTHPVPRGGGFNYEGSMVPAAYRYCFYATYAEDNIGFRVALYVL